MDKNSKHLFNFLRKASDELGPDDDPCLWIGNLCEDYSEKYGISEMKVDACVSFLEQNGYIEPVFVNDNGDAIGVRLTHKAYNLSEFQRIEAVDFLKKSIITPIIVTLLTIIATNLLQPVLPAWLGRLLGQ